MGCLAWFERVNGDWLLLFLRFEWDEFAFAFFREATVEQFVCDTVGTHCLFAEFQCLWAGKSATEQVQSWSQGTRFNAGRGGDEVDLAAALANDTHVYRHGWRL